MGSIRGNVDHVIAMFGRLRDHGNAVLVVEHDLGLNIGPRAGEDAGEVVFSGRLDDLLRADTTTSRALNERVRHAGRQPPALAVRRRP